MFKRIFKGSLGLGLAVAPAYMYKKKFGAQSFITSGPKAIINCDCGKVSFEAVENICRMHVECCCDGCRQRN